MLVFIAGIIATVLFPPAIAGIIGFAIGGPVLGIVGVFIGILIWGG